LPIRFTRRPTQPKLRVHERAHLERQKLVAGEDVVRLDREILIRRLHEVALADAAHFVCHLPLLFERADVLDDGVRIDDVDTPVGVGPQVAGVSDDARKAPVVFTRFVPEVQQGYVDRIDGQRSGFPKRRGAADVQDRDGCGQRCEQIGEKR